MHHKNVRSIRSAPAGLVVLFAAVVPLVALACGDDDEPNATATQAPAATATPAQAAFHDALAAELQQVLDAAVTDQAVWFPGAILRVSGDQIGAWTGTAGVAGLDEERPIAAGDRFRAGSIVKPFVSVVVLQLVEEGALSLDDTLPDVLPASVHARFPDSDRTPYGCCSITAAASPSG